MPKADPKIHMKRRTLWKVNKETNTLEEMTHTYCGRLLSKEVPTVKNWQDATCYACTRAWEFKRMREFNK